MAFYAGGHHHFILSWELPCSVCECTQLGDSSASHVGLGGLFFVRKSPFHSETVGALCVEGIDPFPAGALCGLSGW